MRKVLHVIGALDRGGVEMWLLDLIKRSRGTGVKHDFLALKGRKGALAPEIEKYGSKIIPIPLHELGILRFSREFTKLLKEEGYDIVHTHVFTFSGIISMLSKMAGIRMVIVHSHNTKPSKERNTMRRVYEALTRRLMLKFADAGFAVSKEAGRGLFGRYFDFSPKFRTFYLGIDLSDFEGNGRVNLRREFGIEEVKKVVGHIGRFARQKNHEFLVEIANEILKIRDDVVFLLVGDGPLKRKIESKVHSIGLERFFIFAGLRNDTRLILREVVDLVLFPSLHEGLPITILEAQAAGVPVLLSTNVTKEVVVVDELIHMLPLDLGARAWAEEAVELLDSQREISKEDALLRMKGSVFNIERAVNELLQIYSEA